MSVIIENLTDKPLWLRLNSGESLSIVPRSSAPQLPDGEVIGNEKLEKLAEQGVIRVHKTEGEPEPADSDEQRIEKRRTGAHRRAQ
jgi:hypothetical protein